MAEMFTCPRHGTTLEVGSKGECPGCVAYFETAPDAEAMAPEDREREMRERINGPVTVPFALIHKRIEQLVGRPVFTHEIGLDWDGLCVEARDRGGRSMEEIIGSLEKTGKPVIVVGIGD